MGVGSPGMTGVWLTSEQAATKAANSKITPVIRISLYLDGDIMADLIKVRRELRSTVVLKHAFNLLSGGAHG